MPTRNISLTAEQNAFIDAVVTAGEYQNASEAVRDAIRTLRQRRAEDAARIEALRAELRIGVDQLDRGEYTELEDADLEAFFDGLHAPSR